ncbi:MAG TPA: hypothetical protein PLP14_05040, partial [Chitinophagaceae bacterium]|nr:hypothetical protein [Chitinophagaceae bacterium]
VIVAQRLARRVCSECAHVVEVNPEVLINIGISPAEAPHVIVKEGKGLLPVKRCIRFSNAAKWQ